MLLDPRMFTALIKRSPVQWALVTLSIGGWLFLGLAQHERHLSRQEAERSQAIMGQFTNALKSSRVKYQESVAEMEEMKVAYKETLDKLTTELEETQKDRAILKRKSEQLGSENEMLVKDNQDLMDANVMLAQQTQELQTSAQKIKEESAGWPWPLFGFGSSRDKTEIVKLRDDKQKLANQNKKLEKEIENLYASFQKKIEEIMTNQAQFAQSLQSAQQFMAQGPPPIDLGTLAVSKDHAQFAPNLPPAQANPNPAPAIEINPPESQPRVVSVNKEQAFAIINLGKKNGIEKGQSLIAKEGEREIARLHVVETRDVLAACDIEYLAPDRPLEVNDPVFLTKR